VSKLCHYVDCSVGWVFIFSFIFLCCSGFTYYRVSNLDSRISNADQLLTQDAEKFCTCIAKLYIRLSKVCTLNLFFYQDMLVLMACLIKGVSWRSVYRSHLSSERSNPRCDMGSSHPGGVKKTQFHTRFLVSSIISRPKSPSSSQDPLVSAIKSWSEVR